MQQQNQNFAINDEVKSAFKEAFMARDYESMGGQIHTIYSIEWKWEGDNYIRSLEDMSKLKGCLIWAILYITDNPYEVLSGNLDKNKYHICRMECNNESIVRKWYKVMYGTEYDLQYQYHGYDDNDDNFLSAEQGWNWTQRRRLHIGDNMTNEDDEGCISMMLSHLYDNINQVEIGISLYGDNNHVKNNDAIVKKASDFHNIKAELYFREKGYNLNDYTGEKNKKGLIRKKDIIKWEKSFR